MAIIENGYLRGQIGNVVNRKLGNKNVVQTKPSGKIRQTMWTEASASDFGTASSAGSLIRQAFTTVHQNMHDGQMHNRLVKRMQRVLRGNGKAYQGMLRVSRGNIKRLVDFQFNENSHIYDYVYFDPQVSFDQKGKTTIVLPPLNVRDNFAIPNTCSFIVLKIDVVVMNFSSSKIKQSRTHEVEFQLCGENQQKIEEQIVEFDFSPVNGESIVAAMSVIYLSTKNKYALMLNSEKLNPAGIIAAHTIL
ncbi:hypothetical protein ORI89_00410 [Sphingobacterium sp. UT-1RO-CII-1]|uniref:hypothetical protein n=1 Tax=Sphingobacterium sp. UT-1RO-CII-1 TaxID=2995225 RepID=UPI00227A9FA1|nr:hypothetical protein [Sphingobacterium sp. UT-1RO-CII-1]MCY4778093.1 hypothetical protein [Sphingobacterium sp. UT-1RO-CII-1]